MSRQREEYARLVARGVSNAEACRIVGVNRRTGTRWRTRLRRDVGARSVRAAAFGPYEELVTGWLTADLDAPRKQRCPGMTGLAHAMTTTGHWYR
jgi:hypothetical protein